MPEMGDLVAFEQAGRVILHRVLAVGPGTITAKGDHAPSVEVVPPAQVIGRAVAIVAPRVGVALRCAQIRAGRWIARLSAAHARCGQLVGRYPIAGRVLSRACAAVLHLAAIVLRPSE